MNSFSYLKNNQLSIFLSVLVFFPTIRLLIIGSDQATGFSLLISLIPEFLFSIVFVFFLLSILNNKERKTHLLDKIVLAYFLYNILVGSYLSNDLKASLYGFRLTYLPMLGYFVCSYYWDKKVDFERVFHTFFKVLVFVAIVGLIIYFFFPEIHVYFHQIASKKPIAMAFKGFIRMTSVFWTPVVFGMLMLSSFCYWTYRYLKIGNIGSLVFSLLTINAVFFSVSRGSIIASFIVLAILLFLGRNKKFKWRLVGIIFLELIIFYLFVPQFSQLMEWVFISSGQTLSLDGENTRVSLWAEVLKSIESNPMGLGLGKAGHVAVQMFPLNTPGVSRVSTDGWYFKLVIETGILALVFYLGMSLMFFISLIRYIKLNGIDFVCVIFAVFVATGLVNVVSNALDFYLFSYLYWFLLGLFVFRLKQEINEEGIGSYC